MEIKTTREIRDTNIDSLEEYNKLNSQRWVAVNDVIIRLDKLLEEIDDVTLSWDSIKLYFYRFKQELL